MPRQIVHDHVQLGINIGKTLKNVIYPETTDSDVLIESSGSNVPGATLLEILQNLGPIATWQTIIDDRDFEDLYDKAPEGSVADGDVYFQVVASDAEVGENDVSIDDVLKYDTDGEDFQVNDIVEKLKYSSTLTWSAQKLDETRREIYDNFDLYVTVETFNDFITRINNTIEEIHNKIISTVITTIDDMLSAELISVKTRLTELDNYLDFGSTYQSDFDLEYNYFVNYQMRTAFVNDYKTIPANKSLAIQGLRTYPSLNGFLKEQKKDRDAVTGDSLIVKQIVRHDRKWEVLTPEQLYYYLPNNNAVNDVLYNNSAVEYGSASASNMTFVRQTINWRNAIFGNDGLVQANQDILDQNLSGLKKIVHSFRKINPDLGESRNDDDVYQVVDYAGISYKNTTTQTFDYRYLSLSTLSEVTDNANGEDSTNYQLMNQYTKGGIDNIHKKIELFYVMGDIPDVVVGDFVKYIPDNEKPILDPDKEIEYAEVRENIHDGMVYANSYVKKFEYDPKIHIYDSTIDVSTMDDVTNDTISLRYPTLGEWYWPYPSNGVIVLETLSMYNNSRSHKMSLSENGLYVPDVIKMSTNQLIQVDNVSSLSYKGKVTTGSTTETTEMQSVFDSNEIVQVRVKYSGSSDWTLLGFVFAKQLVAKGKSSRTLPQLFFTADPNVDTANTNNCIVIQAPIDSSDTFISGISSLTVSPNNIKAKDNNYIIPKTLGTLLLNVLYSHLTSSVSKSVTSLFGNNTNILELPGATGEVAIEHTDVSKFQFVASKTITNIRLSREALIETRTVAGTTIETGSNKFSASLQIEIKNGHFRIYGSYSN